MSKDWIGNKNSIYKALGASSHTDKERELNDYYATDPIAIDILLDVEKFDQNIWECACGEGHLSKRLADFGHTVYSTDLIDRGYGNSNVDFLECADMFDGDIITNPPYKYAEEFVRKGIQLTKNKLALFLKLQFLEGKSRKILYKEFPPAVVYVSSSRILRAKNAQFDDMRAAGGSAVAYAWFVWHKGYNGDTIIRWIN